MAHQITDYQAKLGYYRKAAGEAKRSARQATDPDMRLAYLAVMLTWIYLADEIERELALTGNVDSMSDAAEDAFIPPAANETAHKTR